MVPVYRPLANPAVKMLRPDGGVHSISKVLAGTVALVYVVWLAKAVLRRPKALMHREADAIRQAQTTVRGIIDGPAAAGTSARGTRLADDSLEVADRIEETRERKAALTGLEVAALIISCVLAVFYRIFISKLFWAYRTEAWKQFGRRTCVGWGWFVCIFTFIWLLIVDIIYIVLELVTIALTVINIAVPIVGSRNRNPEPVPSLSTATQPRRFQWVLPGQGGQNQLRLVAVTI